MRDEIFKELQEIKQLTLIGAKNALTMNEASFLTGLSKNHLYKLVSGRKIPYYKSDGGKLTYFSKAELEKWLLMHRVPTNDEIDEKASDLLISKK
jgi:excisionase family DNA binding protein